MIYINSIDNHEGALLNVKLVYKYAVDYVYIRNLEIETMLTADNNKIRISRALFLFIM